MDLTKGDVERFWQKVDTSPGCWEWRGALYQNGYGQFSLRRKDSKRKTYTAHRTSYIIQNGEIDPKLMVCHHCDNRKCVRPSHLYAGTGRDNNSDTVRRDRGNRVKGSACSWSKLTEDQVLEILRSPKRNCELAIAFNVHSSLVSQIRSGKRWGHLHREKLDFKTA